MRRIAAIDIFESLGYVNPVYIEQADWNRTRAVKPHLSKTVRTLLIAAIITALFTALAYATGWFGLKARLISCDLDIADYPTQTDEKLAEDIRKLYHRSYISLNGVSGSREYSAAAEWLKFQNSYSEEMAAKQLAAGEEFYSWRDLDRSFAGGNEELLAISRLYGVWDETMLNKLAEIAQKYGLALHDTREPYPQGSEYCDAGIYENGAFVTSLVSSIDDRKEAYALYYEPLGCLPAQSMTTIETDAFEEWEYRSASGAAVNIAIRQTEDRAQYGTWQILVFCDGEKASVVIYKVWSCEYIIGNADPRSMAEALADEVDFLTLSSIDCTDAIKLMDMEYKP